MRRLVVMVVVAGVSWSGSALALEAVEAANPATRAHEHLDAVKVIRGSATPLKYVTVTAAAAESWTASAEGAFVSVSPTTMQTGPGRVTVRLATAGLTGNGPFTGAVVITPEGGGAAVRVPVALDVWPRDVTDLTREELKDRSNWLSDADFGGNWELWGFLPDDVSHPGENAGRNVRTEEKTECPGGSGTNCTRPGQAGLASGQSVDRAWLLNRGDPRTMVAVLDSGIRWRERSLIDKAYLNARELVACAPPGAMANDPATFDVNEDGVFNIRDYDWATPAYVDVNTNGRLDAQDLIRGSNPATNMPCSDGVDDDANGYMDDISGWDFFWNDNDASDDSDYGHGTGEARDSVGQGHDDTNDMGICMRCTLLPVRVGDSFIADVNQFAEGVAFAVDSGASVVQEALGTINNTPFSQQAIDYAWNNNVLVVASAADETSRHHNFPANGEHLINVHAVVFDTDGQPGRWRTATTFLNFNNCTNYGAHLHLSTPGTGCSSEATGKTSGQAGLLYSYYRQLQEGADPYFDVPLTASEAFQVLIHSADDIDVTGAEADPAALAAEKFVSNEGWDEAFGYGRNNARLTLELLRDKKIPPEVYIDSPRWFESFDPTITPSLEITGSVKVTRDDSAAWVLEYAKGVAPRDADFVQVSTGNVARGTPTQGSLGTLMLAGLFADAQTPSKNVDERTITLRLRATVTRGADSVRAEFRKAFSVLQDPQRRQSLALFLGASGEASPRFADLDGDGRDELVLPTSDGKIHAFRGDGTELPGWPAMLGRYPSVRDDICASTDIPTRRKCHRAARVYQTVDPNTLYSSTAGAASMGDLNGDGSGELDVVVSDFDGSVTAFGMDGRVLPGFPVHMNPDHVSEFLWGKFTPTEERFAEHGFFAQPVLVDLEGDGDLEIVVSGMDQWVYAWHHDGTDVMGWPVHVYNTAVPIGRNGRYDERILAPVTVAFLDGDTLPELVVGTGELVNNTASSYLYALDHRGNLAPGGPFVAGFPILLSGFINEVLPYVGKGMPNAVAAADVDGDGLDEILAASMGGSIGRFDGQGRETGDPSSVYGSRDYFGPESNTTESVVASLINNPTVADLNMDGRLDVINGTAGLALAGASQSGGRRLPFQHSMTAWDLATGYMLDGFPQVVEDFQFFMNYAVGDLDGEGKPELVAGTGVYLVHAFREDGTQPEGWPKNTMGWVASTPALGDMDQDNKMEVAVNTREGWLFVWNMEGRVRKNSATEKPGPIQWSGQHHDLQNTGNLRTPLRDYGVVGDGPTTEPPRCGCRSTGDGGDPVALVAGLLFAVWLGRRGRWAA